jgi:AcrR family transcriptional regulator
MAVNLRLKSDTALRLLLAAERLFAEEGVDAVPVRRISLEAAQRNNSALQYHFGSKDALIEAILDYRMTPLNERRLDALDAALRPGRPLGVRRLVELLVLPYVDVLKGSVEDSNYLSLIAQLYTQHRMELLFSQAYGRTVSLQRCNALLQEALAPLPGEEIERRLILMGQTLVHAVARWAHERRQSPQPWGDAQLQPRATSLIGFIEGGLTAPQFAPQQYEESDT